MYLSQLNADKYEKLIKSIIDEKKYVRPKQSVETINNEANLLSEKFLA
jgi:hypothetical protein